MMYFKIFSKEAAASFVFAAIIIMINIKRLKAVCLVLSAVMTIGLFTGCSKKKEIVPGGLDEEGKLVPYSASEVSYEGRYYIKHKDKYYPLMTYGMSDKRSYQWFTKKYSGYIPVFTNGDSLVYINSTARPTSTSLVLMEDNGFTIGTSFNVLSENSESIVSFSENYCGTSPVGSYITNSINGKIETTKIVEINGKPFTRNMIDDRGLIHGLTEGAMYKFNYYKGTVYKSVNLKADTRILLSSTKYSSTSYKPAKNIFYEVVLPENLPNGYYQIPGHGLFQYALEDNIILPNGLEIDVSSDEEVPETSSSGETTSATGDAQ